MPESFRFPWQAPSPATPVPQVTPRLTPRLMSFATSVVGDDYATWKSLVGNASDSTVDRKSALQIGAIKRSRDLTSGVLCTLPLKMIRNSDSERIDSPLLSQPERDRGIVRSVTMSKLYDDLIFTKTALWNVRRRDMSTNYPVSVEHMDYGRWSQQTDGTIWADGKKVPERDCILFISPNEGWLTAAARAMQQAIRLEATAALYAANPEMASEFFQGIENGPELSTEEVQDWLTNWASDRKAHSVGYLPWGIERKEIKRMTADELGLGGARDYVVKEISRITGCDAGAFQSVDVSTRTYENLQDAKQSLRDHTLLPYGTCVSERLSLNDVCPGTQHVEIEYGGYLRANMADRIASYTAALAGGWLTIGEIRDRENLPPLPDAATPPVLKAVPNAN